MSVLCEREGREYTATSTVNHPPYYNANGVEVIKVIEAYHLGFHLGNAVKYILRAGRKDYRTRDEDLRKAAWYINREIERGTEATDA